MSSQSLEQYSKKEQTNTKTEQKNIVRATVEDVKLHEAMANTNAQNETIKEQKDLESTVQTSQFEKELRTHQESLQADTAFDSKKIEELATIESNEIVDYTQLAQNLERNKTSHIDKAPEALQKDVAIAVLFDPQIGAKALQLLQNATTVEQIDTAYIQTFLGSEEWFLLQLPDNWLTQWMKQNPDSNMTASLKEQRRRMYTDLYNPQTLQRLWTLQQQEKQQHLGNTENAQNNWQNNLEKQQEEQGFWSGVWSSLYKEWQSMLSAEERKKNTLGQSIKLAWTVWALTLGRKLVKAPFDWLRWDDDDEKDDEEKTDKAEKKKEKKEKKQWLVWKAIDKVKTMIFGESDDKESGMPRYVKTLWVVGIWVAWYLGRDKIKQAIQTGNRSEQLTSLLPDWFKELFGIDKKTKEEDETAVSEQDWLPWSTWDAAWDVEQASDNLANKEEFIQKTFADSSTAVKSYAWELFHESYVMPAHWENNEKTLSNFGATSIAMLNDMFASSTDILSGWFSLANDMVDGSFGEKLWRLRSTEDMRETFAGVFDKVPSLVKQFSPDTFDADKRTERLQNPENAQEKELLQVLYSNMVSTIGFVNHTKKDILTAEQRSAVKDKSLYDTLDYLKTNNLLSYDEASEATEMQQNKTDIQQQYKDFAQVEEVVVDGETIETTIMDTWIEQRDAKTLDTEDVQSHAEWFLDLIEDQSSTRLWQTYMPYLAACGMDEKTQETLIENSWLRQRYDQCATKYKDADRSKPWVLEAYKTDIKKFFDFQESLLTVQDDIIDVVDTEEWTMVTIMNVWSQLMESWESVYALATDGTTSGKVQAWMIAGWITVPIYLVGTSHGRWIVRKWFKNSAKLVWKYTLSKTLQLSSKAIRWSMPSFLAQYMYKPHEMTQALLRWNMSLDRAVKLSKKHIDKQLWLWGWFAAADKKAALIKQIFAAEKLDDIQTAKIIAFLESPYTNKEMLTKVFDAKNERSRKSAFLKSKPHFTFLENNLNAFLTIQDDVAKIPAWEARILAQECLKHYKKKDIWQLMELIDTIKKQQNLVIPDGHTAKSIAQKLMQQKVLPDSTSFATFISKSNLDALKNAKAKNLLERATKLSSHLWKNIAKMKPYMRNPRIASMVSKLTTIKTLPIWKLAKALGKWWLWALWVWISGYEARGNLESAADISRTNEMRWDIMTQRAYTGWVETALYAIAAWAMFVPPAWVVVSGVIGWVATIIDIGGDVYFDVLDRFAMNKYDYFKLSQFENKVRLLSFAAWYHESWKSRSEYIQEHISDVTWTLEWEEKTLAWLKSSADAFEWLLMTEAYKYFPLARISLDTTNKTSNDMIQAIATQQNITEKQVRENILAEQEQARERVATEYQKLIDTYGSKELPDNPDLAQSSKKSRYLDTQKIFDTKLTKDILEKWQGIQTLDAIMWYIVPESKDILRTDNTMHNALYRIATEVLHGQCTNDKESLEEFFDETKWLGERYGIYIQEWERHVNIDGRPDKTFTSLEELETIVQNVQKDIDDNKEMTISEVLLPWWIGWSLIKEKMMTWYMIGGIDSWDAWINQEYTNSLISIITEEKNYKK